MAPEFSENPTRELPCYAFPSRAFHPPEVAHTAKLLDLLERCKGMELQPVEDGVPHVVIDDFSILP